MDSGRITAWRMRNQRLTGDRLASPGEVVGWLGAVQSQDFGPAKWSVGARTAGCDDADLDRAFADGAILRTHVLRPTWHFVQPADIRWLLQLTAPRVHALNAYYYRQQGLDEATLNRCDSLLAAELGGGNHLTRKEVAGLLAGAGVNAEGLRLGLILMHAELTGTVCSGAPRGKQQTYALLDERAPAAPALSREEALAELAYRYFSSHGPATANDLKWWSSLTVADVTEGIDLAGPRLDREVVDGRTYWFAGPEPPGPPPPSPDVHLLQAYDEYVGYGEGKRLVDTAGIAPQPPPGRAVFNHLVVLDGQLAGRWKRTLSAKGVHVDAALYRPFDDAQDAALRAAADRHGEYLGCTATVTTTVAAAPA
jgi:hypothetical protein